MSAFTLMADIVILNMLLVVSCLPVVTGGAALRSANVVAGEMVQGRGSRYAMLYLRSLTERWKAATVFWVLLLVAAVALVYQQFVVFQAGVDGFALTVIQALAVAGAFIIAGVTVWFYAFASMGTTEDAERGFVELASDAVLAAFRFLPRTVVAVAIVAGAGWLVASLPIAWSVPLTFFIVPGLALYLIRLVLATPLGQRLGD